MSLSLSVSSSGASKCSSASVVAHPSSSTFNKKLFTNLGRAYRPVKRLARRESAIFGDRVGQRSDPTSSGREKRAVSRCSASVSPPAPSDSDAITTLVMAKPTKSTTVAHLATGNAVARFVGWRNYTNLLDITDGLKHQLPNFGYELYLPFVGRLLFEASESSSSFEHIVNRQSNSSSSSSSSLSSGNQSGRQSCASTANDDHHPFAPDRGSRGGSTPLRVTLGDLAGANALSDVYRRDWTVLCKQTLLPLLKILCCGYRDQFRPVTKNYLTTTFALNRLAKRWDATLNQACVYSNVVVRQERENEFARSTFAGGLSAPSSFVIHDDTDEEEATVDDVGGGHSDGGTTSSKSSTSSANVKIATRDPVSQLVKFFQDARNAMSGGALCVRSGNNSNSSSGNNRGRASVARSEEIRALLEQATPVFGVPTTLGGPCPCCSMSLVVLVRAPLLEDARRMEEFAGSSFSPIVVSLDASTFLCGHMPPDLFVENFTLKHVLRSSVPDGVDHDVVKTAYVASLTYFERLFALQYAVAVLVEWCWSRHRLTHAVLHGNNCNYDSVPPVTLAMHRHLFDIVDQVPTVCLQSLARERKYMYHVVT